MNNILVHKECVINECKNKAISIRGENPYCRDHVHSLCELKLEKNIFNECRCNSTVSMIKIGNTQYCNSHYRTLIYKCNNKKCKKIRKNNILYCDKKWYCTKHKKIQNKKVLATMFFTFKNKLPSEITEKIYKIHLKNNKYIL